MKNKEEIIVNEVLMPMLEKHGLERAGEVFQSVLPVFEALIKIPDEHMNDSVQCIQLTLKAFKKWQK
jgi:hypothetical protein